MIVILLGIIILIYSIYFSIQSNKELKEKKEKIEKQKIKNTNLKVKISILQKRLGIEEEEEWEEWEGGKRINEIHYSDLILKKTQILNSKGELIAFTEWDYHLHDPENKLFVVNHIPSILKVNFFFFFFFF